MLKAVELHWDHTVTTAALRRLCAALVASGTRPTPEHKDALQCLLAAFTAMSAGDLGGRYSFPLPAGTGKTSAIVAWVAEAIAAFDEPPTVAVAAYTVEALCKLKRSLIDAGVPAELIALIHSKSDASEPSDAKEDAEGRPVILVTHSRLRDGYLDAYRHYRGKERSLVIYDESLIGAVGYSGLCNSERKLIEYALSLTGHAEADLSAYLTEICRRIDMASASGSEVFELPETHYHRVGSQLDGLVRRHGLSKPQRTGLRELLRLAGKPVRFLPDKDGVISYRRLFPDSLKNIIVLDASAPLRLLAKADRTIETVTSIEVKGSEKPMTSFKRYDGITIHHMKRGGGRTSVEADLREGHFVSEIVHVLKTMPETEAALVVCFKARPGADYVASLKSALREAGIDPDATHPSGKPRICFLTWGNETSLNDFVHCETVILWGIIHRDQPELIAQALGQLDDLRLTVSGGDASNLMASEVAHSAYQALCRGSCRITDDGQAAPMKAYVIEHSDRVIWLLRHMFPGAKWLPWAPAAGAKVGKAEALSRQIATEWEKLAAEGHNKNSARSLKSAVGEKVASKTWQAALSIAHNLILEKGLLWFKSSRGLRKTWRFLV